MTTNFDKTFEKNKTEFKNKFGKDWNAEPQLYLSYIQSIYISSLTEIANNGLGQISAMQKETHQLLQHISKKLPE
jgi:hypothetical protein